MPLQFHDFIIRTRALSAPEFFAAAQILSQGDQNKFIEILKTKITHQDHVKINFHI